MQPSMGNKYQWRNADPNLCVSKNSPKGCINAWSWPRSAKALANVLNRNTSRNMPKNVGLNKLLRCANTVFKLEPLHSMARCPEARGVCTEKDMSDVEV